MVKGTVYAFSALVLFFFIAIHPDEVLQLVNWFMHSILQMGDKLHTIQQQHSSQTPTIPTDIPLPGTGGK